MKEKTVMIQVPVVITHDDDMAKDAVTEFEEDIAKGLRIGQTRWSCKGTIKAKSGEAIVIG